MRAPRQRRVRLVSVRSSVPSSANSGSNRFDGLWPEDVRPRPPMDGWDDPAGLIEAWLWTRSYAVHSPEATVVAWLSTLHPAVAPPQAARSLLDRLDLDAPPDLTTRHTRLLDLLAYVAGFQLVAEPPFS